MLSKNPGLEVVIPVVKSLLDTKLEFVKFAKFTLSLASDKNGNDNQNVVGTFKKIVNPASITPYVVSSVQFREVFSAGLRVTVPDFRFIKTIDKGTEATIVTASIQNNSLMITPKIVGNATVQVTAMDSFGTTKQKTMTITVTDAAVIAPPVIQADDVV